MSTEDDSFAKPGWGIETARAHARQNRIDSLKATPQAAFNRPCFIMSTAIWALAVSTPSQRPLATCPRYLPAPLPSLPTMVRGRGQPAARGKGVKGGKGYHQKGAKGAKG